LVWATIIFKFNQDHLNDIVNHACSLGMDAVQWTRSTKFGSVYPAYGIDDPLQPSVKYISSTHRFEREVVAFTSRGAEDPVSKTNIQLFKQTPRRNGITPLCKIGNKGLYIDARGRLFPCCWVANRYSHNQEWQQLANNFDLHTKTLTTVLADTFWATEFQTFKWQECQTKCKSSVVDRNYATSW
jgi:hypothetical protein